MRKNDVEPKLTIGRLASIAGVNVQTVRYYERCGLLDPPVRSAAGYRMYPADYVRVIRFVKNSQHLGFSLAEIAILLRLRGNNRKSCRQVRVILQAKMTEIAERVSDLQSASANLSLLLKSCRKESAASQCPIIEALDAGDMKDRARQSVPRKSRLLADHKTIRRRRRAKPVSAADPV